MIVKDRKVNSVIPLPPGRHKITVDHYEFDRKPNVGESGTNYFNQVRQSGKLIKTTYETVNVEA